MRAKAAVSFPDLLQSFPELRQSVMELQVPGRFCAALNEHLRSLIWHSIGKPGKESYYLVCLCVWFFL